MPVMYTETPNPFAAGDPFPTSQVEPDYTYDVTVEHKVRIVESYSGLEKRAEQAPARLRFKISYEQLTPDDANILWNHYRAQTGTLSQFSYTNHLDGVARTVRYANPTMSRATFLFEAERAGIELIEVL